MNPIPYHNPKNVESAGEGWRFRLDGEGVASNLYRWISEEDRFSQSSTRRIVESETYRTKAPLPELWIYQDEAYRRGVEEAQRQGKQIVGRAPTATHWWKHDSDTFLWEEGVIYKISDEPKEEDDWTDRATAGGSYSHPGSQCDTKPKVILDWSKLPKEAMWVAMDSCRTLWAYMKKPELSNNGEWWKSQADGYLPKQEFTFSGDWKHSLTPRPEAEIPPKDTTISRSCPCPVAVQVANKILDRADHGFKKYGATLDRGDLTLRDWANHLQEELMDATDYLQVIINKMDQLEKELKQ